MLKDTGAYSPPVSGAAKQVMQQLVGLPLWQAKGVLNEVERLLDLSVVQPVRDEAQGV